MQAQQQVVDGEAVAQPKNTASKFYRVNRESTPERDERVRALHERFVHRTKLRAAWEAQECRDIRADDLGARATKKHFGLAIRVEHPPATGIGQ